MKFLTYLALVVAALFVSTSSYTAGEGSWECLWGTSCTGGFSGAEKYVNFGGTNYLSHGPQSVQWYLNVTDATNPTNLLTGGYCGRIGDTSGPSGCSTFPGSDAQIKNVYPFTNGIYVDSCTVFRLENDAAQGWAADTQVNIGFEVWEDDNDETGTRIPAVQGTGLGTQFVLLDEADSCGVANCSVKEGVHQWSVAGGDDATEGLLQLVILATSTAGAGAPELRVTVSCIVY